MERCDCCRLTSLPARKTWPCLLHHEGSLKWRTGHQNPRLGTSWDSHWIWNVSWITSSSCWSELGIPKGTATMWLDWWKSFSPACQVTAHCLCFLNGSCQGCYHGLCCRSKQLNLLQISIICNPTGETGNPAVEAEKNSTVPTRTEKAHLICNMHGCDIWQPSLHQLFRVIPKNI